MAFQRKVVNQYNNRMARETPNSGATWAQPGDIVTYEALVECKERALKARGEKSFTITKDIIDKIEAEAGAIKPGIVAFGFKDSDRVYVIAAYEAWLELIERIKMLEDQIGKLTAEGNIEDQ